MINDEDKKRNKMNILVLNKELIDVKEKKEIIKSKDLISPQNNENMEIFDYKINLNKYTNLYILDNLLLDQFKKNMDREKIICEICKEKNKNEKNNNIYYRCNTCNINICSLCQSKHKKNIK